VVKILLEKNDAKQLNEKLGKIVASTTVLSITMAYARVQELAVSDEPKLKQLIGEILQLSAYKMDLLLYLESTIRNVAPNVCEIIGPKIASKLVSAAGGIAELAKIPACNIQVLGQEKKALNGMSAANAGIHRGHLGELEMVRHAPVEFQTQLIRMLSTKCALAARMDSCKTHPDGSYGVKLREEI
jgi:U4/U6 small nuclear ribonucleoprotein PRP31